MTDDVKPEEAQPKRKRGAPANAPENGLIRVKIWVDGTFSSLGKHSKGDVVDLPEADAKILCEREFAQEC